MELNFEKYQGTGNDFILLDHRMSTLLNHEDQDIIKFLCDRKFGIGADGLILLEKSSDLDFKMVYFNSDGSQSTMCGNGGRCLVKFAQSLGIFKEKTTFEAIDGIHYAEVMTDGLVKLQMIDVLEIIAVKDDSYQLNTGSPHYVRFCNEIPDDIKNSGRLIRYSEPYAEKGINVNFARCFDDHIEVLTYERGVEDETLSCGTGVTATALANAKWKNTFGQQTTKIQTKGGPLSVTFDRDINDRFTNVWLEGPATKVYDGKINI